MSRIDLSKIPDELKQLQQWVCWRQEARDGKPTKIPYQTTNPHFKAAANDPKTWGAFQAAAAEASRNGWGGVGFVFSSEDDFCGIDLDKCRDPESGDFEEWTADIIKQLDSYTEISPSGTGFHVIIKGKLPAGGNRKGPLEFYDSGRYFTMTGNHLPGTPPTIEARQAELEELHTKIFPPQATPPHLQDRNAALPLSDRELLDKALNADNGPKLAGLYNRGDWGGWYPSPSEADLGLCSMLAFWCDNDPERIDRLFRQSGLMRDKWDRKTAGSTYGRRTIEKAIAQTTKFYDPRKINPARPGGEPGPGADHQDDYEAKEREAIQNEPALVRPKILKTQVVSLADFHLMSIKERRMFLEPWIQEFSLVMIYGPRGAGKTNFALGLVNSLASGQAFGPWKTINPASCLYLDGELPAQDMQKYRLPLLADAMTSQNVYILSSSLVCMNGLPSINLNNESTRKEIREILLEKEIKIFVVDNLSSLAGGIDENLKVAWDPINQWLLELRFAGITTIFLHHDNKGGGQRGTRGREDQVDFVVNMGLPKDYEATDGCRFIAKFEKQRIPNEHLHLLADMEFKLESDESGAPVWTFKNVKADTKAQILSLLDAGESQSEICKLLDIAKSYVSRVKKQAITSGDLTENGQFTQSGFVKYRR